MFWTKTFFLQLALVWAGSASAAPVHVVIDPGHGGKDSGAIRGDVREADITLKVSLLLENLLKQEGHFKTTLTRKNNHSISLEDRARIAAEANADVFLSIHVNATNNQKIQGIEFYFQNQLAPDEESLFIANRENESANVAMPLQRTKTNSGDVGNILDDLKRQYRMKRSYDLGRQMLLKWEGSGRPRKSALRQAPFFVISETAVPSTLIEIGYLSNPEEATKLTDESYQKKLAYSLFEGLIMFRDLLEKDRQQK